jgi:hypothetical protein
MQCGTLTLTFVLMVQKANLQIGVGIGISVVSIGLLSPLGAALAIDARDKLKLARQLLGLLMQVILQVQRISP